MSTAMTAEALFRSGMNLRASGLHHLHVEQVLGGYLAIADHDMKLYLSYSTGTELMSFYERELDMLREGEVIPWLHEHDKASAEEVIAAGQHRVREEAPVSTMAGLLS